MNSKNESGRSVRKQRRTPWLLLTTGVAAAALFALITWPDSEPTSAENAAIVVYKTAACGCCKEWVVHLQDAGLSVDAVDVSNMAAIQDRAGVPMELRSCHTAMVGDYWVEGHVPVDLVQGLIADGPEDILGIAVPGMSVGSPGMEGPNAVRFDIVAYSKDGSSAVLATRQGLAR